MNKKLISISNSTLKDIKSCVYYFIICSWMPFSVGRRNCPGEQVARPRMFLFVTYLLQKFTFSAPDGEKPADPDPRNYINGIAIKPKTFKVNATLRK